MTDYSDIIARALADPVAWMPYLFDSDPDLCGDDSIAPDERLLICGARVPDPLDAVVCAGEAGTRDEAARWLEDLLAARRDRRKPVALDDVVVAPLAALPFEDYWEARDNAAARLGVRVSLLDQAVNAQRRARDRE
jgi:hypothetical protein